MPKPAISHLKKDPKMGELIEQVGEYRIKLTRNRYQSLVEAIITQQLSGSAADSISKKFRALYGRRFPKPNEVIKTSDSKLRKTGLSKMKIGYIKNLSKKIENKELKMNTFAKLSDDEIITELTKIKGIGRWTAEMFLIFSLGRQNVLPVGDLGVKKGFQLILSLKDLPNEKEMLLRAEKWEPYRTVATWYLWKSLKKFETIG